MTAERLRPQKAGAVEYEHVGRAQRQAIKLALRAHADGEVTALALLTLHAVFDRTVSYSKLVDRTSARQLAGIVYHGDPDIDAKTLKGGRRRRVRDAVAALATVGVIEYEGARGGANAGLVVCVPPRDDEGNVLPMRHVLSRRHVREPERAPSAHPTCSGESTERAPGARQHLGTDLGTSPRARDASQEPDPIKRRVIEHFARHAVARDDCVRAVDRLRSENIADHLIDAAIGQAVEKDAHSPAYLLEVARDWYEQRTGTRVGSA